MPHINLIVPDSGPLITLAVAGALDTLLLPDASILIPDMVRHEVIRDLQKAGATAIAQWIRENEGTKVQVVSTETYEEYLSLLRVNPLTKSKNRGERAAAEVLERLLDRGSRFAILLFEDSAVAKQNFLVRLPENVLILSTSSFLDGLQASGLIENADAILSLALPMRGEEIMSRSAVTSDGAPAHSWQTRFTVRSPS